MAWRDPQYCGEFALEIGDKRPAGKRVAVNDVADRGVSCSRMGW